MKISSEEKKDMHEESVVEGHSQYPYGLSLYFDKKSYKKLGLGGIPNIGDEFMIIGKAEVVELVKESFEGDDINICMKMQIKEVDLKKDEEKKDIATSIYG